MEKTFIVITCTNFLRCTTRHTTTGTEAHIRGCFSRNPGDTDNDFELMDKDTKKDIQRFVKRPDFDGYYSKFSHFEQDWE